MVFNFRSLLWYLLADVVVIVAFEVFFPDFADEDTILYLFISSFILWLWDCRKKRWWTQGGSILIMKWNFKSFAWYLLAYVVALTVAFEIFLPGLADKNIILYLFITSFVLWLWDSRKKKWKNFKPPKKCLSALPFSPFCDFLYLLDEFWETSVRLCIER